VSPLCGAQDAFAIVRARHQWRHPHKLPIARFPIQRARAHAPAPPLLAPQRDVGLLVPLLAAIGVASVVSEYGEGVLGRQLDRLLAQGFFAEAYNFWGAAAGGGAAAAAAPAAPEVKPWRAGPLPGDFRVLRRRAHVFVPSIKRSLPSSMFSTIGTHKRHTHTHTLSLSYIHTN
jgi:hypothetical protein